MQCLKSRIRAENSKESLRICWCRSPCIWGFFRFSSYEHSEILSQEYVCLCFRTTAITGFLPQELIGSSGYEFFHQEDLNALAVSHRRTLEGETVTTDPYRFQCKGGHFVPLRTKSTVFRNPWSKELEFLVCVNTVITWVFSQSLVILRGVCFDSHRYD